MFSFGAIVLVLVVGVCYLAFGVLRFNPLAHHLTTTMTVPDSGGIGVGSPVLLSGTDVGTVTTIRKVASGVEITLRLADSPRIPIASTVRIENLSALGEPYVEFDPERAGAPYLADGQVIEARTVRLPTTVPKLSVRAVELLKQLDPTAIRALIDTLDTATAGTSTAMPRLQRSTELLAATILSRTATIHSLLADLQTMGADMDWAGTALTAGGPEWTDIGVRLGAAIPVTAASFAKGIQPGPMMGPDGLVPFLHDLTAYLAKIGPRTAAQLPALQPLLDSTRDVAARIDLGALITQALNTVGPDGAVHLEIHVK
ncbi:MlaD family protein [Nocardia sp. NPDC052001]|uniref:MlaD family protein n=1 Tax=Nocardia sp. NPDC052001 TaxID=3154853 RepID=UPI0034218BEE